MENKNQNNGHSNQPTPMTGKEKAKILTSLFGVGLLTVMAYWAQSPATPIGSENFQTNIAADNNPTYIAQNAFLGSGNETSPSEVLEQSSADKLILEMFQQALEANYTATDKYPTPSNGNYACTSELTELKEFFPNSQMPLYPPSEDPVGYNTNADSSIEPSCTPEEGYLYVTPKPADASSFSYMLIAKVQDVKNGNLPKEKIKTDGSFIAPIELENSGEYFVIVGTENTSSIAKTTFATTTASDTSEEDLFDLLGVDEKTTTTSATTTSATTTSESDKKTETDSTESPVSRFSNIASETAKTTNSTTATSAEVGSIDLGNSAPSEIRGAASTSPTKDLPDTGAPVAGYLIASLVGGYILQRTKQRD